jgi:putative transposase
MPHIQSSGSTYSCNSRTATGKFLTDDEKTIVFNAILFLHGKHYELFAVVVMPDHFHLIIQPIMDDNGASVSLPRIFHSIKSFTSNKLTKVKGVAWQDEHWDHIIRDEAEFYEQIKYIENNPVEAGLTSKVGEYRWLWHIGMGDMPTSI